MEDEIQRKQQDNDKLSWLKTVISLTSKSRGGDHTDSEASPKQNLPIPFLSPIANSVISRCSKILAISAMELQHNFDEDLPDDAKPPPFYARNFLEFCSYKALSLAISQPNYLNNKEFRSLTFDMMLAWEAPELESNLTDNEVASCSNQDVEDGWSLFYSNSTKMAVQVDDKKTVGPEAFARIAPACPVIADIVTVHNLFDVLTSSSGARLHFLIYDKFLRSLEKVMKSVQNAMGPQLMTILSLAENEILIDVDGTIPTQPVLQHIGMSAWPGRLTLTNYALYFESGVGLYDKAVKYDLAKDIKQVIKPELTGPLGARLFDKAVMYKSTSIAEPVYLEFPEFKGCSRRDYWLDVCLEILRAHKFIRKFNMKGNQKSETLARAVLGIFRHRAVRDAFRISSSNYKTLLCFNLAESLPGGDLILETLSSRLSLISGRAGQDHVISSPTAKKQQMFPAAFLTLSRLGIVHSEKVDMLGVVTYYGGDVCVGELNPLETVVKQLKRDTGRAEAAQATVDQVKVEGIDTNLAVMKNDSAMFLKFIPSDHSAWPKVNTAALCLIYAVSGGLHQLELLFPLIEIFSRLQHLASWEDPYKSVIFVVFSSYSIYRGLVKYILPSILVFHAIIMFWRSHTRKLRQPEAFKIVSPPSKNAVEQLIILQEAITQVESLIQSGNIILLKVRALLFAVAPQATDKVALLTLLMAVAVALLPLKYLMFVLFLECFTRNMPLRKESSDRGLRRAREWWTRIPAAPVQLIRLEDKKRK